MQCTSYTHARLGGNTFLFFRARASEMLQSKRERRGLSYVRVAQHAWKNSWQPARPRRRPRTYTGKRWGFLERVILHTHARRAKDFNRLLITLINGKNRRLFLPFLAAFPPPRVSTCVWPRPILCLLLPASHKLSLSLSLSLSFWGKSSVS